jgi:hypothetical protein
MVKHFTKEQRYTIIKCIKDCDLLGFSDKEGMKYIEDKIGKSISIMSYQRYKNRALKDTKYISTSKWVSYQAKIGHIESYRKRLDEMELINQETLKLWYKEIKKEEKDQDKDFIIALIQLLQKNNSLLLQISFTTPVADFIRNNTIEQHKQIIELNQKYNELVNQKDNKKVIKEEEQKVLEEYNYQKNNFIC